MAMRIRKTFRAFAMALALVVAFAYVAGARTVFVYREFRCAPVTRISSVASGSLL